MYAANALTYPDTLVVELSLATEELMRSNADLFFNRLAVLLQNPLYSSTKAASFTFHGFVSNFNYLLQWKTVGQSKTSFVCFVSFAAAATPDIVSGAVPVLFCDLDTINNEFDLFVPPTTFRDLEKLEKATNIITTAIDYSQAPAGIDIFAILMEDFFSRMTDRTVTDLLFTPFVPDEAVPDGPPILIDPTTITTLELALFLNSLGPQLETFIKSHRGL